MDHFKLFPSLDETIDCLDFTKIYLKVSHHSSKVAFNTSNYGNIGGTIGGMEGKMTGRKSDVDRFAYILEQKYQDAHDLKEEKFRNRILQLKLEFQKN